MKIGPNIKIETGISIAPILNELFRPHSDNLWKILKKLENLFMPIASIETNCKLPPKQYVLKVDKNV